MDLFENSCTGRFDSSNFGLWLNLDYALTHPLNKDLFQLMLPTFHYPMNEKHKEFIASLENEEDISFAINCFSMFSHEMRHFHDLLITPYGSMLMRQYTRGAILSLTCHTELSITRNKIVIPLSEWVSDSNLFHKAYSIDPPSSNLIYLNGAFNTMKQKFETFNKGITPLQAPFDSLDTTSILEGLAILNQELLIEKTFGKDKVRKNFRSNFKSPSSTLRYYGAINFILRVLNENVSHEVLSYLLFCSLCGNFQETDINRARSPKDVLVEMLLWIKNKKIKLAEVDDFDDIISIVDEFFDEQLGNDVQGMITQAAKVNEEFENTISVDVKRYENVHWSANELMKRVQDVFNNFRLVQASFGANIFINPLWYCSEIYLENQYKLPSPVLFLESEIGLPIDESLEKVYYIQTESRMKFDNLRDEAKRLVSKLTDKEGIVRSAHILSPRKLDFGDKDLDNRINWWFEVPEVNVEQWQRSYDTIGTEIRCLIEGENLSMNKILFASFLMSKAIMGTEVYSSSGKFPSPDLPDDLSSTLIEPYIRELFGDKTFRDFVLELRKQKKEKR